MATDSAPWRARSSPTRSSSVPRERVHDALGAGALPGGEAELVGHQRERLRRAQPVEVGAVLASDLEHVGEALGGDQRRARAALLEQRVGAHGHPVGEGLDLAGTGARPLQGRLDRGEHAPRLVVRRGGRLRRVQRRARRTAPRR